MAAIPPLFTPGNRSRTSTWVSVGASPNAGAQDSPRLRKKTPGSDRRKSFARKPMDQEKTTQGQSEDEGEVHNESEGAGDSVPLEQYEVASASTLRAPASSTSAAHGSNKAAARAEPPGRHTGPAFTGSISGMVGRKDVESPGTTDEEYGFQRFVGYRWVRDSIEIHVEWDTGEATWEPETNLHQDCPEALFEYWREQGGRPKNPTDPEIYEVFAILKHNKNRSRLLVEWVGFEPSEASWTSRKIIEETAKDVVDAYFDSLQTTRRKA
ncbi:chromo domain [Trichoderma cornu-damae]|uniref:Chromo domain n=1 Tax=Trichoderma cornu-damae TaxID=654480 RepID=A0A9P8QM15_9HYPO|nr:chromo domain [Trichoderma cornu-damae]